MYQKRPIKRDLLYRQKRPTSTGIPGLFLAAAPSGYEQSPLRTWPSPAPPHRGPCQPLKRDLLWRQKRRTNDLLLLGHLSSSLSLSFYTSLSPSPSPPTLLSPSPPTLLQLGHHLTQHRGSYQPNGHTYPFFLLFTHMNQRTYSFFHAHKYMSIHTHSFDCTVVRGSGGGCTWRSLEA